MTVGIESVHAGGASSPASTPWHALTQELVFEKLQSRPSGLDGEEVQLRQREVGPNALPVPHPPGPLSIFLHQFISPLIYILLVAGGVSFAIGEYSDGIFIFAVILLNATLGGVQEWKAERSAAALQKLLRISCHVRRNGHEETLPAEELVPGDIVLLESGSRVPADLRLLACQGLRIDESLLTGESVAVLKQPVAVGEKEPLGERTCMAYGGTTAMSGRGTGVVVATGVHTEVGDIARAVTTTVAAKPPLVVRMERFARQISVVVVGFVLLLGGVALFEGTPLAEVFFMAVALAVSAIPEGLPVAMTVALSIATARMARRNVIVRRLPAVEALGSCTCIASDKTGTLTVNRQTAKLVQLPGGLRYGIGGEGYNDQGVIAVVEGGEEAAVNRRQLARVVEAAVLCNEAELWRQEGGWHYGGDAVDIALLALGYKLGLDPNRLRNALDVLGEIPFESENRYSALLYRNASGAALVAKGAVETLLSFCDTMVMEDGRELPLEQHAILEQTYTLAEWGYRVIAVATAPRLEEPLPLPLHHDSMPRLKLLGLVGLIDPLRPEAIPAVARCRRAGVRVLMVTGDHPATALALASELGIASGREQLVTGADLEQAGDPTLPPYFELVERGRVFSRVTPLQKLQVVATLDRLGHFVAVTGDGVNDAPALRRAHIGVAMGSGCDIAKDTASLLITDDDFASLQAGIEEGRFAYDNIRKVIYLLISTGAAEILLFTLALLCGLPLPLAAVQLLWLNLVTNGIQDVALAFEGGEPGALDHPPRPPEEGIFNPLMVLQTLVSGLVMGLVAFAAWWGMVEEETPLVEARNQLLLLMVLLENVHVFNCRSERISAFRVPLSRNWLLIAGVLIAQGVHILAMHLPFMQSILGVAPLTPGHWLELAGEALLLLLAMELFKLLRSTSVPSSFQRGSP